MANKFYITTSIAYTNAEPHIGYALELSQADVLARYHRLLGEDVYFLTGTDEHGTKIERAAAQAGKNPQEFVDAIAGRFKDLTKALGISNSDFIRTTDKERHWPGVEKIWRTLQGKGALYEKEYEGLYCVGHEAFINKSELEGGFCPIHKTEPESIKEKNLFFRLSDYKNEVRDRIERGELKIIPESRKNEVLNLFSEAEDVSFSRPVDKLTWGIPVPGNSSQTIYVWADALTNYISALGYGRNEKLLSSYWPSDVHLIGKDILRFHAMIWPAMLLAAELSLPKAIYVHGFITSEGQKMSKSLGNVIDPFSIIEKYGAEVIRYFLLREIPSGDDGDFSVKSLEERYNGDLANGLGNLTARVFTLVEKEKFQEGFIIDELVLGKIKEARITVEQKINEFKLHEALAIIWNLISFGDGYINEHQVWKTKDKKVLTSLIVLLDNIAYLLSPFLPETAKKITDSIEWHDGTLIVKKGGNLFPRLT